MTLEITVHYGTHSKVQTGLNKGSYFHNLMLESHEHEYKESSWEAKSQIQPLWAETLCANGSSWPDTTSHSANERSLEPDTNKRPSC